MVEVNDVIMELEGANYNYFTNLLSSLYDMDRISWGMKKNSCFVFMSSDEILDGED